MNPRLLKRALEKPLGGRTAKPRLALIATEGYKMKVAGLLITLETVGHVSRIDFGIPGFQ
jgi:hypothetical protein